MSGEPGRYCADAECFDPACPDAEGVTRPPCSSGACDWQPYADRPDLEHCVTAGCGVEAEIQLVAQALLRLATPNTLLAAAQAYAGTAAHLRRQARQEPPQ